MLGLGVCSAASRTVESHAKMEVRLYKLGDLPMFVKIFDLLKVFRGFMGPGGLCVSQGILGNRADFFISLERV